MAYKRYLLLLSAAALLLVMPACSKNKTGTVKIQFVPKAGQADLQYGAEHQNSLGQTFKMSLLRFYVSELALTGEDPETYEGSHFSIDLDNLTITAVNVPKGDYTGISFGVGVEESINHSDPTAADASSPLNPAHDRYQHWDWNTGYIFIKLEGTADTTTNGVADANFLYHIGTDDLYKLITINSQYEVAKDETTTVNVEVDVAEILKNIDFKTEIRSHTSPDTYDVAVKIANNIPGAFRPGN